MTTEDGGALVRIIAGEIAGHAGPGVTFTPITFLHATIAPGAELAFPWNPAWGSCRPAISALGTSPDPEREVRHSSTPPVRATP